MRIHFRHGIPKRIAASTEAGVMTILTKERGDLLGTISNLAVDKLSIVPIYHQIKEAIRQQINSGVLKKGDRVPSLREFSEAHRISLMTVRQAFRELVSDGLLEVRKGKGTFVVGPRIDEKISTITSFTNDMRKRGLVPSTKVLRLETVPCSFQIAEMLDLGEGEPVFVIRRLRLADGEPMTIQTSFLPAKLCPGILEKDLTNKSMTHVLEDEYGLSLKTARQRINAGLASAEEAKILNVAKGFHLLRTERVSFTDQRQPVEYLVSAYRSDRYDFVVELRRED